MRAGLGLFEVFNLSLQWNGLIFALLDMADMVTSKEIARPAFSIKRLSAAGLTLLRSRQHRAIGALREALTSESRR